MAIRRQKESSMRKKKTVKKSSRTKRTRDKTKTARGKVQGTDFIAAIMPVDQLANEWGGGLWPQKGEPHASNNELENKASCSQQGVVGGGW